MEFSYHQLIHLVHITGLYECDAMKHEVCMYQIRFVTFRSQQDALLDTSQSGNYESQHVDSRAQLYSDYDRKQLHK
jgi:hypothetical protein